MAVLSPRYPVAALALALTAAALSGCAPAPEPSPTPTAMFASEEEAFAAAEEVYRAYNEAGNARIAGKSSPNPQDFLIGEALEADIDGIRFFDEHNLRLSRGGAVASIEGVEYSTVGADAHVSVVVCLDVSEVRLLDANGADVTPAERGDVVSQMVEFIGPPANLRISLESEGDVEKC